AVHAGERTGPSHPSLASGKVICRDQHSATVQKRDIDQLTIGGGRAGGEAVQGVLVFEGRREHGLLPEQLARLAVQAEDYAVLRVEQGADREDAVTPHDRGGVTQTRQFGFPNDVAGRAPADGHCLFAAGAVETRAAPTGPVFGEGGAGDTQYE